MRKGRLTTAPRAQPSIRTSTLTPVPDPDTTSTAARTRTLVNPTDRAIHVQLTSGGSLLIGPMRMVEVPADEHVLRATYQEVVGG
jgi:hypothetical protein